MVRIGPRHLSYTDPRAWKDIFGHRAGDHIALRENGKSEMFYRKQLIDRDGMDAPNILDADREEHSRLRRAVAAGFSDRSMREHEPIIMKYVDQLMGGLRRKTEMGEEVDMVKWYNWTTFDVIGDLVFAESFGCLKDETTHPFVDMVTGSVSEAATFVAMKYAGMGYVPGFRWALNKLVKWAAWDSFKQMMIMMEKKLRHRLDMDQERNDLFEGLMSKREEWVSNPVSYLLWLGFVFTVWPRERDVGLTRDLIEPRPATPAIQRHPYRRRWVRDNGQSDGRRHLPPLAESRGSREAEQGSAVRVQERRRDHHRFGFPAALPPSLFERGAPPLPPGCQQPPA